LRPALPKFPQWCAISLRVIAEIGKLALQNCFYFEMKFKTFKKMKWGDNVSLPSHPAIRFNDRVLFRIITLWGSRNGRDEISVIVQVLWNFYENQIIRL